MFQKAFNFVKSYKRYWKKKNLGTKQVVVLPRNTYSGVHSNSLQLLLQNIELHLHTVLLRVLQMNFKKTKKRNQLEQKI